MIADANILTFLYSLFFLFFLFVNLLIIFLLILKKKKFAKYASFRTICWPVKVTFLFCTRYLDDSTTKFQLSRFIYKYTFLVYFIWGKWKGGMSPNPIYDSVFIQRGKIDGVKLIVWDFPSNFSCSIFFLFLVIGSWFLWHRVVEQVVER